MVIAFAFTYEEEYQLATWAQVRELILSSKSHPSAKVDETLIKVEVMTERGRSQIVYVGSVDDTVTFASIVCKTEDVNLDALFASKALSQISYGIGPVDQFLAVKHVQPLESIDLIEIAIPIAQLAVIGDLLEAAITGKDAH
jgi:hypothetical protein